MKTALIILGAAFGTALVGLASAFAAYITGYRHALSDCGVFRVEHRETPTDHSPHSPQGEGR